MNEDDNKPVRLVVNNSNEISDLSTLEISVPFGEMAAQINEWLADGSSKGLFASVLAFVEACREAELKAEEVDGLLSTLPNFSTGAPVNDPIDTVLRGAVRMAAAITTCACRKSNPDILMMQPAQYRATIDVPCPLNSARYWRILLHG
jgi:hypothetical protein